ncbi:hypothetical protein Dimus_016831 [Dionaea muscipula]
MESNHHHGHATFLEVPKEEEVEVVDRKINGYEIISTTTTTAVRSYGCLFCQQGFTSAQALGGHMNIHRKDKASMSMNSKRFNRKLGDHHAADHDQPKLASSSTSSMINLNQPYAINDDHKRLISGPIMSVAKVPSRHGHAPFDVQERIPQRYGETEGHEELDLELRLGNSPY